MVLRSGDAGERASDLVKPGLDGGVEKRGACFIDTIGPVKIYQYDPIQLASCG